MLRVLITGITGFAGSHLAEHLVSRGDEVHGLAHEPPPFKNLAAVEDRVRIHEGDITRLEDVQGALAGSRADAVVHLAGMAVPTLASSDPVAAVRVNVLGTAAMLTALEQHTNTRLVLASSADVYGAPDRVPVDETAPVRPGNVYSATKVAAEALAIAEILQTLLALARIPVRAELDPSRVRGGEPTRIALDAARFRQKTGWSPRIALADSLRDTLDFWRSSVRQGARV